MNGKSRLAAAPRSPTKRSEDTVTHAADIAAEAHRARDVVDSVAVLKQVLGFTDSDLRRLCELFAERDS